MNKGLLVGAGGFLGSVCRYTLSSFVQHLTPSTGFPFGTLTVNLLGCFVIGVVAGLAEARSVVSEETRVFLVVGVLGGFTTFSAFGNETWNLFRDGASGLALANIAAQVVFGLGCVWCGRVCASWLWP